MNGLRLSRHRRITVGLVSAALVAGCASVGSGSTDAVTDSTTTIAEPASPLSETTAAPIIVGRGTAATDEPSGIGADTPPSAGDDETPPTSAIDDGNPGGAAPGEADTDGSTGDGSTSDAAGGGEGNAGSPDDTEAPGATDAPETTVDTTTTTSGSPTSEPDVSNDPSGGPATTVVKIPVVEAPTPTFAPGGTDERDVAPESSTRRNGSGVVWTLDEAGERACVAAEEAITAIEVGADAQDAIDTVLRQSPNSVVSGLPQAAQRLSVSLDVADVVSVLYICAQNGYEL